MAAGGTVLRSGDGSLYFIRDEVLSQCKVEGEYVGRLNDMLEKATGEVEGFSFDVQPAGDIEGSIGYVTGDILSKSGEAPAMVVKSTIMCPW